MTETILVTGASRGLGRAAAERLGADGAKIIALARTVGGLEELDDVIKKAGGPEATLVPLDLADGDGIDRLGAALYERDGKLDGLIHCAAAGGPLTPLSHLSAKDAGNLMTVNALATHRLIRSLDPLLAAASGRALFVADDKTGQGLWGGYAASKAAAAAFAQAYGSEQARVRVGAHQPPAMPTALRGRTHPGEDRAALTPVAEAAEALIAAYRAL